tara:strand:+ start:205 stop:1761 length:1557 start_codon:yes stop_codon:yes gene_type:complete
MNFIVQYQKWTKEDYKKLNSSVYNFLKIKSTQFYMPFYSLYFYIHNKANANKKIDLKRNYYLKEILEITKSRYYNSNVFLKGSIYNENKNITEEHELFCKSIPIVDPMHTINNNYNFVNHNNYHLPSNYNYNTFNKINDIDNTAYIDVLCSYLFGNLTYKKINPSFALYYGSLNGIGNYNYDISEDYDDIKYDKSFNDNIDKGFKLEIYISDSEEEEEENSSDEEKEVNSSDEEISNVLTKGEDERTKLDKEDIEMLSYHVDNNSSKSSSSSRTSKSSDNFTDCIAKLTKIPIQLLFIEKLEGTLEDLIDDNISEEILLSCLFQISFALIYLQKHFLFTHNDLHINNIMFQRTENKYLYYKYNNIYYKVPTHGYIFKIIDFGRAIFKYHNKVFMNDVFSNYGEAGGQYSYPNQVRFTKNKDSNIIKPNYHFDLCRLSMTIVQELKIDNYSEKILEFMNQMCTDKNDNNFCDMEDNFYLYKSIAKDACNCLPREIIMNDIFKSYRVKKKLFPRKSYYTI